MNLHIKLKHGTNGEVTINIDESNSIGTDPLSNPQLSCKFDGQSIESNGTNFNIK